MSYAALSHLEIVVDNSAATLPSHQVALAATVEYIAVGVLGAGDKPPRARLHPKARLHPDMNYAAPFRAPLHPKARLNPGMNYASPF
jgi:hypothetical protein